MAALRILIVAALLAMAGFASASPPQVVIDAGPGFEWLWKTADEGHFVVKNLPPTFSLEHKWQGFLRSKGSDIVLEYYREMFPTSDNLASYRGKDRFLKAVSLQNKASISYGATAEYKRPIAIRLIERFAEQEAENKNWGRSLSIGRGDSGSSYS